MINHQEWLRTRKNLLDQVKSQVQLRVGPPSVALRQYAKSLDSEFRGSWKPVPEKDFISSLARAKVVLSGDFHAYAQSQRAHLRILRDLAPDKPVVLALECLPESCAKALSAFMSGRISEKKFLDEIKWNREWGFPWENYRPLLELARDRGFEVRGLGGSATHLGVRDRRMAEVIRKLREGNPGALIYVVVGEWHLASRHLPGKVRGRNARSDVLVLFQDNEHLYFRGTRSAPAGGTEYLKGQDNRFCLMVSPPWMKWQSYLMYLEQAYDRDLQEDIPIDYSDHVAALVEVLEKDLKLTVNKARLQVYSSNSRVALGRLKAGLPRAFGKILVYNLEHDLSFLLPEKDWLYLSRPTINHASTLAGQFIHAQLARRKHAKWDLPRDFTALIWIEAIGFFFSKWINPKRKAEDWDALRIRLEASHPKDKGRMALLLALDHRLSEVVWTQTRRLRKRRYQPRDVTAYVEAARLAGELLGERLFQKVRSKQIRLPRLLSYLKVSLDGDEFSTFYWNLIRQIERGQKL
jgi:hypothetical protein